MALELVKIGIALLHMASATATPNSTETGSYFGDGFFYSEDHKKRRPGTGTSTGSTLTIANNPKLKDKINFTLLNSTIKKYEEKKESYGHFLGDLVKEADFAFNQAISRIMNVEPISLVVGLTNSHSIYFRFNTKDAPGIESNLEVFFDGITDNQVETVCTCYTIDDKTALNCYGSLDQVFAQLSKVIMPNALLVTSLDET